MPKTQYASRDFYDAWLPELAPSAPLVAQGLKVADEREWRAYAKKYRAEMKRPEADRLLTVLASLSHQTNFAVGCYCKDENRCHRSILRSLLEEHGAEMA